MKAEQLRKSILQLAIQGKLVKQDPNDEPASVLLERIRAEKQRLIKEGKIKKDKGDSIIFKGDDNCHYEKIGSEVKNIEDEIDFDLPDGWEYIRLCTVCWLDDVRKSAGEKLPYLDAKTLRGKTDLTYLNEGKIVHVGTKVILVDGENSGEVFDVPFKGYMGSTFKILGSSKYFNLQYLNLILDFYKDVFRGNKIGAAIPHLNKNLFKSLIIGLPPVNEQKRIVEEIKKFTPMLTEYDRLEQQATKLDTEIYDKLKKSILQYAIQGKLVEQDANDEPASVLLERIRAEKKTQLGKKYVESYIYKGDDNCYYEKIGDVVKDISNEIPFDIPDLWEWTRLNNISIIQEGAGIRSFQYRTEGIQLLTVTNILEGRVDLKKSEKYVEVGEFQKKYSHLQLQNGDIVTACSGGSWGKSAIFENDAIVMLNTSTLRLRWFFDLGDNLYLYLLTKTALFKNQLKEQLSGMQPNFGFSHYSKILLPVPPLSEQIRIYEKIKWIFNI